MSRQVEVVESKVDHAIGSWRNVVLYVWRGHTTAAAARRMQQFMARIRRDDPDGARMLLGVVEEGTTPPDSAAKTALGETLRSGNDYVCASALVFEGEGFSASMVRAVATSLAMFARTSFPHHVFANVDAGSAWLERRQPDAADGFSATELAAALGDLRTAAHR